MENLVRLFNESIQRLGVSKKHRLLLAVSGGMDSVVMTACCAMTGLDFEIAHANFQLRDLESMRDENFVRSLAKQYDKPFLLKTFDTTGYAADKKVSIQVGARNLRYNWLMSLIGKETNQYQFLLTAHHLDDNIETMLMHFFRGTGIRGLMGMPEKNEGLIRPLLTISKKDIHAFALSQNLAWVIDSTNAKNDYTRNYFRNQLIPSIGSVFPEIQRNMEKNLKRFSEAANLYQQAILLHKKKLLKPSGAEWQIPILLLKKSIPLRTILYELIRDFHFSPGQMDDVIQLVDSTNGKFITSSSHRIIKNRRWLMIAPLQEAGVSHFIVESPDTLVSYPEGSIRIKNISREESVHFTPDPDSAWLDAGKIQFPLILRKWKTGDYFYPLGMKKKKKLARFFIDRKLSKTAKEKIWVVETDNRIVWVVGLRIDNRFCIHPGTHHFLLIRNEGA